MQILKGRAQIKDRLQTFDPKLLDLFWKHSTGTLLFPFGQPHRQCIVQSIQDQKVRILDIERAVAGRGSHFDNVRVPHHCQKAGFVGQIRQSIDVIVHLLFAFILQYLHCVPTIIPTHTMQLYKAAVLPCIVNVVLVLQAAKNLGAVIAVGGVQSNTRDFVNDTKITAAQNSAEFEF